MLVDFGGSVLVVSHDRWLLDRVATAILAFEGDGRVEYHVGNYADYAAVRVRATREEGRDSVGVRSSPPSATGRGTDAGSPAVPASAALGTPAQSAAKPKKLSFAEQRELDGMLDAIAAAEAKMEALQARLADPATYQGEGGAVAGLRAELEQAEAEVGRLTARWELLESRAALTASR